MPDSERTEWTVPEKERRWSSEKAGVELARLWLKRTAWLDAACKGELSASQIQSEQNSAHRCSSEKVMVNV